MNKFKDFIARCEDAKIGFGLWICTFLSLVFMRDAIESLAVTKFFPLFNEFHLLHFPIFYISTLLAVIILIHFFSKENIVKVSRVSLLFFAVIILPAAVDFILSLIIQRDVGYEYIVKDLGKTFINFFNPFFSIPAVPFSIRIEIALITFFSFIYIFLKRNKVILSLIGAFSIFTVCFFYIAVPGILVGGCVVFLKVLSSFLRLINFPLGSAGVAGTVDESIVVMQELLLTVPLALIWVLRYDVKKGKALLANIRVTRSLHYMLLVVLGFALYLGEVGIVDLFVLLKVAGMLFAIFFAFQFSVVVNDIFDIDCDRLSNKKRPLITGILDKEEYLRVGYIYLAFSLLFAFWVSQTCFMITLFYIIVYFVYSAPPFRLKRFFPISSLVIAIQALLAFMLGQMSLQGEAEGFFAYSAIWWLVFVVFFLSSNVKDLKDIEGDRRCNVRTLPVIFGETRARILIGFLVFLSYLIVPLFLFQVFYSFIVTILALLFGLINYFYIKREGAQERVVFYLYFMYALVLLLFMSNAVAF